MKFEITILGCGSAVPLLGRRHSAQVVNLENTQILLDCGEGTQLQLRKFGIKFQNLDVICITHMHGDHILGLPGLLQTFQLLGRTQKLMLVGPPELEQYVQIQFQLGGGNIKYPIEFVVPTKKEKKRVFENNRVAIDAIPLKHKIPTWGYLVAEKSAGRKLRPEKLDFYEVPHYIRPKLKRGEDFVNSKGETIENQKLTTDPLPTKQYFYCTDTAYFPELKNFVPSGVNLMYHEASFLENEREKAHLTLHSTAKEAGKMAFLLEVDKMIIGHFSARYKSSQGHVQEAQTEFKQTEAARDGAVITL